jgi:hypothetical protein
MLPPVFDPSDMEAISSPFVPPDGVYLMSDLVRLVDEGLKRLRRHRERYVRAWVAATGVHPADAELVEEHRSDGVTVVTVRRRTP